MEEQKDTIIETISDKRVKDGNSEQVVKYGKHFLNIREVAEYLGLSTKTLYNWAENGQIPCYKLGRLWRFDRDEIDKFVKAHVKNQNIWYNNRNSSGEVERNGGKNASSLQ